MKFSELKKYLSIFIVAVAVIVVYKTFDNFGYIIDFFADFLGLLTPFFIGAAIAFVLCPMCKKTESILKKTKIQFLRKYRRGFSVLIDYIIVLAVIVLIFVAIIPQLIDSISNFVTQSPALINKFTEWINSLGLFNNVSIQGILESDLFSLNKLLEIFDAQNVNKYAKGVMNFGSTIFDIFFGIIISVYLLLERRNIKHSYMRFARAYFPEKFRNNLHKYCKEISTFINQYIGCQLLDACIVFILSFIALTIMRNEYAAVFALMVGSFNLIPYFGAIIAVIISAIITLISNGLMSAVILVIVLVVLQQIDANIIQPRLVASSLSIKPLLVILGVILGGGLFGVIGFFIGVPIIALLKNIIVGVVDKKTAQLSAEKNKNV